MPVERRGVRALQIWCRRVTDSYPNVSILDMDHSWRDGLAFCAIIHHFRPNLIPDFDKLTSDDVFENHSLAYRLADEDLGIPSLLDPEDFLDTEIPDKFSIVTYVSQFYHLLKDEDNSKSPSMSMLSIRKISPGDSDMSGSESPVQSPMGTPKSVPRSLFTSTNPILRSNKFSPHNSPLSQSPVPDSMIKSSLNIGSLNKEKRETETESDLQTSLCSKTHFKSESGVTVSAVCDDLRRKIKIFEER